MRYYNDSTALYIAPCAHHGHRNSNINYRKSISFASHQHGKIPPDPMDVICEPQTSPCPRANQMSAVSDPLGDSSRSTSSKESVENAGIEWGQRCLQVATSTFRTVKRGETGNKNHHLLGSKNLYFQLACFSHPHK